MLLVGMSTCLDHPACGTRFSWLLAESLFFFCGYWVMVVLDIYVLGSHLFLLESFLIFIKMDFGVKDIIFPHAYSVFFSCFILFPLFSFSPFECWESCVSLAVRIEVFLEKHHPESFIPISHANPRHPPPIHAHGDHCAWPSLSPSHLFNTHACPCLTHVLLLLQWTEVHLAPPACFPCLRRGQRLHPHPFVPPWTAPWPPPYPSDRRQPGEEAPRAPARAAAASSAPSPGRCSWTCSTPGRAGRRGGVARSAGSSDQLRGPPEKPLISSSSVAVAVARSGEERMLDGSKRYESLDLGLSWGYWA